MGHFTLCVIFVFWIILGFESHLSPELFYDMCRICVLWNFVISHICVLSLLCYVSYLSYCAMCHIRTLGLLGRALTCLYSESFFVWHIHCYKRFYWPFTCQSSCWSFFISLVFVRFLCDANRLYVRLSLLSREFKQLWSYHCICVHQEKISAAAWLEPGTPGLWVNHSTNELSWRHRTV